MRGKVAVVMGADDGIGRAISLALGARGVCVVVAGFDEKPLGACVGEIANGGGRARHLAGDMREPAQVEAALTKAIEVFHGVDIVVATAALEGDLETGSEASRARWVLEKGIVGVHVAFHAAAPRMREGGRLIATSITPGTTRMTDLRLRTAHSASDAGVTALVRALADELAPRKIVCNAVRAAWDATESSGSGPEDVAEIVAFLCGPAAAPLTGQTFSLRGRASR